MPLNDDEINRLNTKLQTVEGRLENARGASSLLESQVGRALDRLLIKGQGLEDIVRAVNSSLIDTVNRMGVINPILNQIFGSQKSTVSSSLSGIFGNLLGNSHNQSFPASQNQINAAIADAVGRGSRLR